MVRADGMLGSSRVGMGFRRVCGEVQGRKDLVEFFLEEMSEMRFS